MIVNTIYNLKNRLRNINFNLQIIISRDVNDTKKMLMIRAQLQKKKNNILKYLKICDSVFNHIIMLQRKTFINVFISFNSYAKAMIINQFAIFV